MATETNQEFQQRIIREARQETLTEERLREVYLQGCREERTFQEKLRAEERERERFKRHLDWLFFGVLGVILGVVLAAVISWASL
jgi:hypothetical protein